MKLQVVKLFVLSALFCTVLSESTVADKKPSAWKRVKKALLSRPAKVAYGCVTAIALLCYGKKRADENERARSLRNGNIIFSCLAENEYRDLRERFIDRYMPDSRNSWYNDRPYFYSTWIERGDSSVNVIIRDRAIGRDNSIALLHRIQRDILDMNAYAQENGKSTCWTAVIEKYELCRIEGMPLREDFDVPRYQLKITIPSVSGV